VALVHFLTHALVSVQKIALGFNPGGKIIHSEAHEDCCWEDAWKGQKIKRERRERRGGRGERKGEGRREGRGEEAEERRQRGRERERERDLPKDMAI
jgi:hypothetical protein